MLLTSLVFGACLGTILALIVFGATPFVRAAGPFVTGPSNVAGLLESAHDPLVIALCGMPLQFVYAAASFYFEATRQPKIVTSLAILGLITATGSALLLIPNQAKFGLSTAAAAALSFTVPRIVQGVGSLVLSLSQQRRLWPLFLGLLRDRFWANVKCLVHIGLPMSVSDGTTTVAVMSMTFLIGVLGVSALNVYQITSQFLAVLMLVGSGLCTSIVIRVTNAVGARDNQSQIVTFRAGLIALCILDMLAFSLYAAFPNAWANLYKAGAEVATGVHANQLWALLIFAIECPLILLTGIARAHSQMVRLPVIKAVCFVIIAIPLCYFVTRNLVAPTGYLLFGIVPTVAFALGIAVWQVTRASMPSPAPDQIHMH